MVKRYEDLTFADDFMFCRIMQYDEEIAKKLVELIIGRKVNSLVSRDGQKSVEITPDGRGVRFDVYLEDDEGVIYNIEMQNSVQKEIGRRARYYQSMIDVDAFERGALYESLNNSYVIFITGYDPFGFNLPVYTFRNICYEDKSIELGDGTTKIFLNTSGVYDKISEEMKAFMMYLASREATDDFTSRIEETLNGIKRKDRWKGEFMTLYEHYQQEFAEGLEQGRAEGICDAIDKLVKKQGITVKEACAVLEITEDDYNKMKSN